MIIVKGDLVVNFNQCIEFYKTTYERKFCIFFSNAYYHHGSHQEGQILLDFEDKSERDIAFCEIIEAYDKNYRIVYL